MTNLTRRAMVRGLAGIGLAPLVNTGCQLNPCDPVGVLIIWFMYGDAFDKDAVFANLERGQLSVGGCDDDHDVLYGMAKGQSSNRPAVTIPSDGMVRLSNTAVRGAVIPSPDRVWLLDTYGESRLRILGVDPVRHILDLPIAGGPRIVAMSPDKSTVYVLRTPSQGSSLLTINTQTNAFATPFTDFPNDAFPNAIGVSPDGTRLLISADKLSGASALYVISVPERRTLRTIDLAGGKVSEMVFTPDSQLCFCLRTPFGSVPSVWAFDVEAMEFTAQLDLLASNPKLAMSITGDRVYVSQATVEPFDPAKRLVGLAAVDTSSLRPTGYIPYTDNLTSARRIVSGLYPHRSQNLIYASFQDETGYSIFDLAERTIDGPYVPDSQASLGTLNAIAISPM